MAEYIEREAAIDRLEKLFQLQAATARSIVEAIPAADVQPVRHGRWEKNNDGIMIWWECSECHHDAWYDRDDLYNYCPNCGAHMGESEVNNNSTT